PEVIVGLLGILKAGGVYLPLDASYPGERLAFMLQDAGARVVLTEGTATEAVSRCLPSGWQGQTTLAVGRTTSRSFKVPQSSSESTFARDCPSTQHGQELPVPMSPDHLAYVIYTSGSTGLPKGVAVSHRQLLPVLAWSLDFFHLKPSSRVLQNLSYCFDFGLLELATTLLCGGTLCFADPEDEGDFSRYPELIARQAVNTVHTTPSFFRGIVAQGRELPTFEIVHLGGESLTPALLRRIESAVGEGCRIFNGYGPTEAAINAAICALPTRPVADAVRGASLPIGRATANAAIYLFDRHGRPATIGACAELAIGGDGPARGYLNRPALTAEKFVPDPFSGDAGTRLYRSGDLARFLPDGRLEFLGRIDRQVKLRGLRIELGEIESVLARQPSVAEAAVLVREEPAAGEEKLVAFVVGAEGDGAGIAELRSALRELLPAYMVPAVFVPLEALPRTPHGKVDRAALARHALPAPPERSQPATELAAPRSPVEEMLAEIWAQLLGHGVEIGIDDDFFDLGGHSLLAVQVISRVRRAFAVEIALRELFAAPTVAGLAARIEEARGAGRVAVAPPLEPLPRDGDLPRDAVPLSFAQQRLWFLDRLEPGSSAYNVPTALRLRGVLRLAALKRALAEIVRRHQSLRTS
ncbi:MAG: amino acid adenylation domain-containing protein, partial [bacterium]|nr:amino acid adenylation domain-containing protein [bacterium]